jgi:Amt family ammonium transporter
VWGGGWAVQFGSIDFAGGTVVHISSGFAALALALVIGKRVGFGQYALEPANIPMAILGAALLWFGWFGFNAGSALAANGLAANAFVATNTAAASAAMTWLLVSWIHGKPSSLGFVSGAVAGLVAITPGAGYVTPMAAIVIGAVAGVLCYGMMLFRIKKGLDESLDAWSIHGMGGLWGALATGIFAMAAVNGASGLIEGNINQFVANAVGAFSALIYAFVVTYILAVIVDKTIGLRVTEEEEYVGLDISQHGERA